MRDSVLSRDPVSVADLGNLLVLSILGPSWRGVEASDRCRRVLRKLQKERRISFTCTTPEAEFVASRAHGCRWDGIGFKIKVCDTVSCGIVLTAPMTVQARAQGSSLFLRVSLTTENN